jgi:hypothetical protein
LIAAYVAYVRLIERRPVTELGTQGAAGEFATGFVVGGFLFSLIMLILWLSGVVAIGVGAGWTAAADAPDFRFGRPYMRYQHWHIP